MRFIFGIVFVLLAASSFETHSDFQHLLREGRTRYEGFLSGLLNDPYFKVSSSCLSSDLTLKVEEVFESAVNIFFNRDISQALKFYYSASNALEYFANSCNLQTLIKQFYSLCVYQNACNVRNFVTNLKNEVHDVMMHLGNQAYTSYQIENTWDEEEYFKLVRDKYRHIGGLVGLAFGEKHNHALENEEEDGEMHINQDIQQLNRVSYVEPSEIKEDYVIVKHFLQGIIQGLSEKGSQKKSCYKNLSYIKEDFNTGLDLLVKSLGGDNNIALISLAATQTYGHLKGIFRDCRLSILGGKLLRLYEINENLNENKEELNAILVNFGMAAITRDFVRAGQLIGNLIKISIDFHVY